MIKATVIQPVQTYTVNELILFNFNELKTEIQEKLLSDKRKELYNDSTYGYFERQDFFDNMQKVFDLFYCSIGEDSYDNLYIDRLKLNKDIQDMTFKRCIKYILSVYNLREYGYTYKQKRKKLIEKLDKLHNNKVNCYYYKLFPYNDNSIKLPLHPELQPVTAIENYSDSLITGYYTDYCFFDALKAFVKYFNGTKNYNLNIRDFLDFLLIEYKKEWNNLNDELYSNDYIKEYFFNEYYFDINGNIIDYKILSKEVYKNE